MKQAIISRLRATWLLITACLFQAIAMAQDSTVKTTQTNTSSTETTWHIEPWMWIVGGVIILLILVLLLRGNSNSTSSTTSDRVTVTKTVERDTNV